jgi:hypothetical protein
MFRALGIRDFRLIATGQLLSGIGDWLLLMAAPYFVLRSCCLSGCDRRVSAGRAWGR